MGKRWRSSASAAVCLFCILFGAGLALGGIDIPDKLKDIPLYQGSKVQHAINMENNAMIMASVKAKADAIADFYKNLMVGKGWKLAFQSDQEDAKILHFQKDKQVFQITVSSEKKSEEITYTLMVTSQ
ncbi:MAG: hypothetical protein ABSH41_14645 [Syntrophobacteraceae bacterium]